MKGGYRGGGRRRQRRTRQKRWEEETEEVGGSRSRRWQRRWEEEAEEVEGTRRRREFRGVGGGRRWKKETEEVGGGAGQLLHSHRRLGGCVQGLHLSVGHPHVAGRLQETADMLTG